MEEDWEDWEDGSWEVSFRDICLVKFLFCKFYDLNANTQILRYTDTYLDRNTLIDTNALCVQDGQ